MITFLLAIIAVLMLAGFVSGAKKAHEQSERERAQAAADYQRMMRAAEYEAGRDEREARQAATYARQAEATRLYEEEEKRLFAERTAAQKAAQAAVTARQKAAS